MLRCSILTAMLLSAAVSCAQINLGKDECGPLFDLWVERLRLVKQVCCDSVPGTASVMFNDWYRSARTDIKEGKYKVLRRGLVADARPLISVIDVVNNERLFGGDGMDAREFFAYQAALSEKEKNIFKTLHLVFSIRFFETEQENYLRTGLYYSQAGALDFADWEKSDINEGLAKIYKFLLDIIEDNRTADPSVLTSGHYDRFSLLFRELTGVKPPPYAEKEAVKQYLEYFALPLAYGFGRQMLFDPNDPLHYVNPDVSGNYNQGRYGGAHFNKLFNSIYPVEIENLIQHIQEIKKNSCARATTYELGEVLVDVATLPAQPVKNQRELKEPASPVPPGKARLLIVAKTSHGRLLNSYDHNIFSLYPAGGGKPLKLEVNSYGLVPPGHYYIKNDRRPYDSVEVNLPAGASLPVEYVPSTAIRAVYYHPNGSSRPLDFRVDYLVQNKLNAYKLDTIYCDVIREGREAEFNQGLFYVRPLMPPNFYPSSLEAEVATEPNQVSVVSVSGYALLQVQTYDGQKGKRNTRAEIFTAAVNPKTGRRTRLAYINTLNETLGRFDTLFLAPGQYWIEVQYPFTIGRETEITSGSEINTESFENIGSLFISAAGNITENKGVFAEITDLSTNEKIQIRSGVPVDLPADRKYQVRILKDNSRTYDNVVIRAGEQTVIRW